MGRFFRRQRADGSSYTAPITQRNYGSFPPAKIPMAKFYADEPLTSFSDEQDDLGDTENFTGQFPFPEMEDLTFNDLGLDDSETEGYYGSGEEDDDDDYVAPDIPATPEEVTYDSSYVHNSASALAETLLYLTVYLKRNGGDPYLMGEVQSAYATLDSIVADTASVNPYNYDDVLTEDFFESIQDAVRSVQNINAQLDSDGSSDVLDALSEAMDTESKLLQVSAEDLEMDTY